MATKLFGRKGAEYESNAAGFVILMLIAVGIVAYIILLPPEFRSDMGIIPKDTFTLLSVEPGKISAAESEAHVIEHGLPSFVIDGTPKAETRLLLAEAKVSRSAFSGKPLYIAFQADKSKTAYVRITAFVNSGKGTLMASLNNSIIFSQEKASGDIEIEIPVERIVDGANQLKLDVSSPGFQFWALNSYSLSGVSLATGTYDSEKAYAKQSFSLGAEEVSGMTSAKLTGYARRISADDANINIKINGQEIYDSVPFSLDTDVSNVVKSGTNTIEWAAGKDSAYEISFAKILVKTGGLGEDLKKYSFRVSDFQWANIKSRSGYQCWLFAESKDGASKFKAVINGNAKTIIFSGSNSTSDICDYLVKGSNSIALTSEEDIEILKLKIMIVK